MEPVSLPFSKSHEHREKRSVIMGVAAKLFNENGISTIRHEDLSNAIGLSKTSVSYYFDTKDTLALACYAQTFDILNACIAVAKTKIRPLAQYLCLVREFGLYWHDIHNEVRRPILMTYTLPALSTNIREEIIKLSENFTEFLLDLFTEMQVSGQLDQKISPQIIGYLYNCVMNAAHVGVSRDKTDLETYIDVLRTGIASDPAWDIEKHIVPYSNPETSFGSIFDREMRTRLKRKAFITAGVRKFNVSGYDGTGLSEIAKELGVTRGAFYHHFKDKKALLIAGFDNSLERISQNIRGARLSGRTGRDKIAQALLYCLNDYVHGSHPPLKYTLINKLPPVVQKKYRLQYARMLGEFEEFFIAGQDDESLSLKDYNAVSPLLFAMLQHAPINKMVLHILKQRGHKNLNLLQIPKENVQIFITGLSGRPTL